MIKIGMLLVWYILAAGFVVGIWRIGDKPLLVYKNYSITVDKNYSGLPAIMEMPGR